MRIAAAPARWLLCVALVAALAITAQRAIAEPVERPFNRLTSLVVSDDLRTIHLFGIFDPDGPAQDIPYGRLFADALALPAEAVVQGVAVPGFSLDFPAAFSTRWPAVQKKLADVDSEFGAYLGRNGKARDIYVTSALAQALNEARDGIRAVLKLRGIAPPDIDKLVSPVRTIDDLQALVIGIQRAGLLRADDRELNMSLMLAVEKFRQAKGNVFFYPDAVVAGYVGIPVQTEPRFHGINPNSQLARITLEGDVALKAIVAREDLKALLPFHLTRLEWKFQNLAAEEISAAEPLISVNLSPKNVALSTSPDGRVVFFDREEMAITYRPRDTTLSPSASQRAYGEFLSGHFDDYARKIAPLWTIRELYKVVAAARHLKARGVTLTVPAGAAWSAPRKVDAIWQAAALGTGGGTIERVILVGGVNLSTAAATKVAPLPASRLEAARAATAQLDSVFQSGGNGGVCFDGQPGCRPGVPLGVIKVGGVPRGAAGISSDVLTQMKARPELKKLVDDEQRAKAAWDKTQQELREKQASLGAAKTSEEKGRLQVELSNALQKASNAKSVLDTTQVKVEQGAKLIVSHK